MMRTVLCACVAFGLWGSAAQGQFSTSSPVKPIEAPTPGPITWAHIELKGDYPEGPQLPGLFGDVREGLSDALARLERAAKDDDVSGIILRINDPTLGWGKLHEFRRAIHDVRQRGKKVYAVLDSASASHYLLATNCDEIIMPESGTLLLYGMRAEVSFYKNLLDLLEVKADMLRVGAYKSGVEPYTRSEMSPQFREELEGLLDDYYRQIVDAISEGRGLDRDQVTAAIDAGPYTAAEAKQRGLIDRVAYEDEIEKLVGQEHVGLKTNIARRYGKKKLDTDFSGFAGFMKFLNLMMGTETGGSYSSKPKIAVIHAQGMIMSGRSQSGSLFGGDILGSDTLVKAIRKAKDDAQVKAIVLRVDSPGGSALASDLIWRALDQVDKPVVVSMGDVAASGGYYISAGADCIFAEPGTLTGSIGVFGGKLALKGLYEKVGITTSVVSRGKNSGLMSTLDGFNDSEREAMTKMLQDVYDRFTRKAAQGRHMALENLLKLAGGRVYTGAMAKKVGLVDRIGTLDDAVAHARQLAGLKPDDDVERMLLPKPVSPFEQLFGPLEPDAQARAQSSTEAVAGMLSPDVAEHLQAAQLLNLLAREPALTVMPFRIRVK